MPYVKLELEEYIKRLDGYSPEQIENVKKMRTQCEYMSWEQYQVLLEQKLIERFCKLRKPRTLWVDKEGNIFYLSHYDRWFKKAAKFKE